MLHHLHITMNLTFSEVSICQMNTLYHILADLQVKCSLPLITNTACLCNLYVAISAHARKQRISAKLQRPVTLLWEKLKGVKVRVDRSNHPPRLGYHQRLLYRGCDAVLDDEIHCQSLRVLLGNKEAHTEVVHVRIPD